MLRHVTGRFSRPETTGQGITDVEYVLGLALITAGALALPLVMMPIVVLTR